MRFKFTDFHAEYCSANRMKLLFLGREPLDVLQNGLSSCPPTLSTKTLSLTDVTSSFRAVSMTTVYSALPKPVVDLRELQLFFPFIDEELLFASQPCRYTSHLIGHEGP